MQQNKNKIDKIKLYEISDAMYYELVNKHACKTIKNKSTQTEHFIYKD